MINEKSTLLILLNCVINDTEPLIKMFKNSVVIKNRKINNYFDPMNRELVLKKN